MADDRPEPSTTYPLGQLERAVEHAVRSADPSDRARARTKVRQWERVLHGMADGTLTVGSRTPVAGTPAWVTPEVVHGGFATTRLLAETRLEPPERKLLLRVRGGPGATDREKINLWYLTDDGLAVLRDMLATGRYRVEVPEDAALPTVAWLLDEERYEAALDLVAELRPWMDRLRLAPLPADAPRSVGATVRLRSAHEVAEDLRARSRPRPITDMKHTLLVWNPLFDELVGLWAATVESSAPTLTGQGDRLVVSGGWPCTRWPADWAERRTSWLAKHDAALAEHGASGKHHHPRSNYARLAALLMRCPTDSRDLSAREVGWIRRCLANTTSSEGPVDSDERARLRGRQRANAERPDHADIARVVADRLSRYPQDGGIPHTGAVDGPVTEEEAADVPNGTTVPPYLAAKTRRAVEAPVRDLIDEGILSSSELLATVLPQMTAQVMSEGIDDPHLRELYRQVYGAFRRRRSLLLLDLEHQVRLEELPWVSALPTHTDRAEVQEVAADIFMGTFTRKWPAAATVASAVLEGTVYARYYDLPPRSAWPAELPGDRPRQRTPRGRDDGPATAELFAARCRDRATEAGPSSGRGWVAVNGAVLEQSQILTTHNLAVLVDGLELRPRLAPQAERLAVTALGWAIEQLCLPFRDVRSSLQTIKNAAYGWRQGIFFLSLVDDATQQRVMTQIVENLDTRSAAERPRVQPVVGGLRHVIDGGYFQPDGWSARARRLLGWSVGPHWLTPPETETARSGAQA